MRIYECEETAFKAWLQNFQGIATRQASTGCVLARFFQDQGVQSPAIAPSNGGDYPNWMLRMRDTGEEYLLPEWATQVVINFDAGGGGGEENVTADELREEFA